MEPAEEPELLDARRGKFIFVLNNKVCYAQKAAQEWGIR